MMDEIIGSVFEVPADSGRKAFNLLERSGMRFSFMPSEGGWQFISYGVRDAFLTFVDGVANSNLSIRPLNSIGV
jgi:hypothetical protein